MREDKAIKSAQNVLKIEAQSILQLIDRLDRNFSRAVLLIYKTKGRLIVTGIGKSGLVGKKISATMTSTGTQAIFLHPVEGMHGDLGIVTKEDVVLAISNSGETEELNVILESIRKIGAAIIAFTGKPASTLAKMSDIVIDVGVEKEACPFGMAPTSSTTAALAMGDALAVALIEKRKFTESDFYKFHPGGSLGLRLLSKVSKVMITGSNVPKVSTGVTASEAVRKMDEKNVGFVLVVGRGETVLGILTDGDIRRHVSRNVNINQKTIDEIMSCSPKMISNDASIADAIAKMQQLEITTLVVVNGKNKLLGYIHLHDVLGRGGSLRISLLM